MPSTLPWWKALAHLLDKETGWPIKLAAAFALVYTVMPLDLVPDVLPVLGWIDDALVLLGTALYVIRTVRRMLASRS
jgi:uncharacterized membrane protein YkvA (DUF1232 family)